MMNELMNCITEKKLNMLDYYREQYAFDEDRLVYSNQRDIKHILHEGWGFAKQDLFQLFGKQLILSREFEYIVDESELERQMELVLSSTFKGIGRDKHKAFPFVRLYSDWYHTTYPVIHYPIRSAYSYTDFKLTPAEETQLEEAEERYKLRKCLKQLVDPRYLSGNNYKGETCIIPLPNGKSLKVQPGCKPMKILQKLADIIGLEKEFEEFRLTHSLVHNQKKLKGTMHLSIHPMDYFTMSDNSSDWSSCMSWTDHGGYRAGTVEMLNSPVVIVAYMTGTKPYHINNKYSWNNKKWRQLFIVDKTCICGIKSYPYHNKMLSDFVCSWLRDLAQENMGWTYVNKEPINWGEFDFNNCVRFKEQTYPFAQFDFAANNMYNDFCHSNYHPFFFTDEELEWNDYTSITTHYDNQTVYIWLTYSGVSQCMLCGDTRVMLGDESFLVCDNCCEMLYCAYCGERIYDGDASYDVDGEIWCEYCYDNHTAECEMCGEYHLEDRVHLIQLMFKKPIPDDIQNDEDIFAWIGKDYNRYATLAFELRVDEDCLARFENKYNIQHQKIIDPWNGEIYAYWIDDLPSDAILEFIKQTDCCHFEDEVYVVDMICKLVKEQKLTYQWALENYQLTSNERIIITIAGRTI